MTNHIEEMMKVAKVESSDFTPAKQLELIKLIDSATEQSGI